jgi:HK97 gp10 family phage protein
MSDGLNVKFRKKDQLLKKLRKLGPALDDRLRKATTRSAQDVANDARAFVPVRLGKLRDGITFTLHKQGFQAAVGVFDKKLFYASFVEFGTSRTSAQPFLFPAYRLNLKRIKGRYSRAINKSVREAIK